MLIIIKRLHDGLERLTGGFMVDFGDFHKTQLF